ncbi:MAG: hypothetical protein HY609_02790 [Deltaproteobacteria bacterium]|nr:hypothetical protein [Deltaproteobacteria bacterium]MBI4223836.1 hypothetical protein [Deltaproteobacteria bacterium]
MADVIQNVAGRLRTLLSTPSPAVSRDLSGEFCALADRGGAALQYLYAHMLDPRQQTPYGQIDDEDVVGGQGFVYREKGRKPICFNFAGKNLSLACDPKDATRDISVQFRTLKWEEKAREICEEKMKTWGLLQKELSPEEAMRHIEKGLPAVSLVEALIPKALPLAGSLDETIRRVHRLLTVILEADSIEDSLKKRYGLFVQKRMVFYLLDKKDVTVVEKTQYQSAINKMLNDFNQFLETSFTAFNRDAANVLSWKSFIALFLGGASFFGYNVGWRERIRMMEQQQGQRNYVPPSKATIGKARSRAGIASSITTVVIYLGLSALLAYAKKEGRREDGLTSCFPPTCPLIRLNGSR